MNNNFRDVFQFLNILKEFLIILESEAKQNSDYLQQAYTLNGNGFQENIYKIHSHTISVQKILLKRPRFFCCRLILLSPHAPNTPNDG